MGVDGSENPLNDAVTKPRNGESIAWAMPWRVYGARAVKSPEYQLELTKLHPPYPQELTKALSSEGNFPLR
jgi:hypothetical protein